MLPIELYYAFALICSGYAGIRGAAPERIGAAIILVGSALSTAAMSGPTNRYASVEIGAFLVDVAALVAFLFLSMRAERFWPLCVTALQVIGTAGHAVKLLDPEVIRTAYAFVMAVWSYPMWFLILLGTWNHQRRLAKYGVDKSWSSFSGRSGPPPRDGPIG
jgi:hypothetical protein